MSVERHEVLPGDAAERTLDELIAKCSEEAEKQRRVEME